MKRHLIFCFHFLIASCSTSQKKPAPIALFEETSTNEPVVCVAPQQGKALTEAELIDNNFDPEKLFSFDFLDMNIREAFVEISQASGIPIIADESVNGNISASFKDMNINEVMDIMTSSGPYDFKKLGKYYFVGSLSNPESLNKIQSTFSYHTKYLKPSTLKSMLGAGLKNYLESDDGHRFLNIQAPRRTLLSTMNSIQKLDVAQRQILLKVTISEISSKGRELIGHIFENQKSLTGLDNMSGMSLIPSYALNPQTAIKYVQSLVALQRSGDADIKARPSVLVSEGETAEFGSTIDVPIQMGKQRYEGIEPQFTFLKAGIKMSITPVIAGNDEIILNIGDLRSGELSGLQDYDNTQGSTENKITTTVRVKSKEAILLGGMLKKDKTVTVTQVPLIGDLPVIGYFFKNKVTQENMKEVVFSIQPEILCN